MASDNWNERVEWVVHGDSEQTVRRVACELGVRFDGRLHGKPFARHFRLSHPRDSSDVERVRAAVAAHPHVQWHAEQTAQLRVKRDSPTSVPQLEEMHFSDPRYLDQWHLNNTGQWDGLPGVDANTAEAWEMGYRGARAQICIVDDGVDWRHQDVRPRFVSAASLNLVDAEKLSENDPTPTSSLSSHGTRCATAATAEVNSACGVGVAFEARIAGVKLLAPDGVPMADPTHGLTTDALEAEALSWSLETNDIMSSSWGPLDDGYRLEAPGPLTRAALEHGVTNGRGGWGTIYVWAGGNGGRKDNCNHDGYASSPLTISVTAVSNKGTRPYYAEECAAHLVAAPSSGGSAAITTGTFDANGGSTDACTSMFTGTSASSPLAAGVLALVLDARPNLHWRDVQHILVHTARLVDATDQDWVRNGANHWVNHKYGFGLIDASAAVRLARTWPNANELTSVFRASEPNIDVPVRDGYARGVNATLFIDANATGVPQSVESVVVGVSIESHRAGDLEVELVSPAGTLSLLAAPSGVQASGEVRIEMSTFECVPARFGEQDTSPASDYRDLPVLVAQPPDACAPLTNGRINSLTIVYERASVGDDSEDDGCDYVAKVRHAQRAGARAVIVVSSSDETKRMDGTESDIRVPAGMVDRGVGAHLAGATTASIEFRSLSDPGMKPYTAWNFTTVRCWDESPVGEWTLRVRDVLREDSLGSPDIAATLHAWNLTVYGPGDAPFVAPPRVVDDGSEFDTPLSPRAVAAFIALGSLFIVGALVTGVVFLVRRIRTRARASAAADVAFELLEEAEEGEDGVALDVLRAKSGGNGGDDDHDGNNDNRSDDDESLSTIGGTPTSLSRRAPRSGEVLLDGDDGAV